MWKVSLEDFRRLLDVPKSYRPSEINKYVLKPIEEELGPLLNLKVHRKYLKKKPDVARFPLSGSNLNLTRRRYPAVPLRAWSCPAPW